MKRIKFGIIACSQIAHTSTLPAILQSKNAEIEMIGSRTHSKAKEFASEFQCGRYGTYEEVLENPRVDAVYISTPVGLHKKWCIKAAKASKHIICEKSSTSSYADAQKIIHEASKNNVRIMEGFMFRFHPSHQKIRKIIKCGKIGDVYSFFSKYGFPRPGKNDIRFQKKIGGGILNDAGCYPVCASRMIFEKEPIGVMCQSTDENGIDVRTVICLKYGNSQFAQMVTGYGLFYQSSYSLWGTGGSLELSRSYNIPSDMKPAISLKSGNKEKRILVRPVNHFKIMIESFSSEIKNKKTCNFVFEDDLLKQARVMDACRKSSKQNKFIEIKNGGTI